MTCPKCGDEPLRPVAVASIEVDACRRCGGLWCDDRELQILLDAPPPALAALRGGRADTDADSQPARCPRDGGRLVRMFSSRTRTVTADACPDCQGIWLDGGELERLRAAR